MNLLAHAVLTPEDAPPGVLVGNLTADWVKGKARHALPPDLRAGIALHRGIDSFTDTHPIVEACSALLEPAWNRYSPVLVDIFFDHVLSTAWEVYSPHARPAFIADTYDTLREHISRLPERARHASCYLLADDWFSCYATLDGIALSLSRLSARLNHSVELAPAVADFRRHEDAFRRAFAEFFPQLRAAVETLPLDPLH